MTTNDKVNVSVDNGQLVHPENGPSESNHGPARHWNRDSIWMLAIASAFAALYWSTFGFLWERWRLDTQYSLAYLVPFVSGYFTWRLWNDAAGAKVSPSKWGIAAIVVGMLFHFTGVVLDVSILSCISMLLCFLGMCLYLRGSDFVKSLWFPLVYMLFMIPIPGGIIDLVGLPMQMWASASTCHVLQLMGIDVVRNGVNLSLPNFTFEVAIACSGMSSLVALVGVTAVFAYITKLPFCYRWMIFLLSLPVALAANVVRITTIALVGNEWGSEVAMDMYHDWSSPILFVVAIMLLFLITRGFEWLNARRTMH